MARTKFLLLGLILLLGSVALLGHVVAGDMITPTLTASGPIEVVAGASGHNTLTFGGLGLLDSITNVLITCSGLPTDASFSLSPYPNPLPGPISNGNSFILTITTSLATSPATYPITCGVSSFTEPPIIAPSFGISRVGLSSGAGSLGPDSIFIQQAPLPTFYLIVTSATPIPEYPLGLALLAIFMIIAYGVITRKTRIDKT
ncbi:MAG: hypothetical protein ACLP5V_07430 [Candidatus Bathyarchaeia archaeon]